MNAITRQTRAESYLKRPLTRKAVILETMGDNVMTARQIANALGFADLNAVKPRLTELLDEGKVEVVAKVIDCTTGRRVAAWAAVKEVDDD